MNYDEFRQQYEAQHPASVPVLRYEMSVYPAWVRWAVIAMFIAAAIISGVHTVPTVYQTIEADKVAPLVHDIAALASFIAVELAILLSAYLLKRNARLGWLLLITTSFVAGIANLQSSMTAMAGKDDWTRIVAIAVGLAAPLIVLASGKLLVDIFSGERTISGRAEERYLEACKSFDAEVLAAFKRDGKRQLSSVSAAPSAPQLPSASAVSAADIRTHGHGQGYGRNVDSRERVRAYLREHPEDIGLSARVLAEKLGDVGKTIVSEELTALRKMGGQVIEQAESVIYEVGDAEL